MSVDQPGCLRMKIGVLYLSHAILFLAELIAGSILMRRFACILAKWFWPTVMNNIHILLNLAHRIYLHPPSVLTSIGCLDLYEDYLLKDLARVFQLNQLARSNKDMILQDGHGQLCTKAKEPRGGNRSYEVQTGMCSTPDPVIMTLQIPNYTVCLNLFENHLAHAFYHTFDFNLIIGH